jgi:DNA polymerase (family X)
VKTQYPEYSGVEIAGDFRRGCELVMDLAIVAETRAPSGAKKPSGKLKLAVTDKKHFGACLLHATGSAAHLELLAKFARTKRFDLKPDGSIAAKR